MHTTKRRVLSLLLALVLILGLLPGESLAAARTVSDFLSGLPLTADPGTGTTAWKVVSTDDGEMLRSGNRYKPYSSSTLKLTFTEDTQISFEYRVSSEEGCDTLTIGAGLAESGEGEWQVFRRDVLRDETLEIVYRKDGSGDEHEDAAFLRNFSCGTGEEEAEIITFHDGEETATQELRGGKGTLQPNPFTRDRAVFAGWALSEGGEVVYGDGAEITVTGPLDLYAVWLESWRVTFVDGETTTVQDVPRGECLSSLPDPEGRTGYTFLGWFQGETEITADTPILEDLTCTARYSPIHYTVRFDANGGEGTMDDLSAVYGKELVLPECGFTREGYHFLGWSDFQYVQDGRYQPNEPVINLKREEGSVQTAQ